MIFTNVKKKSNVPKYVEERQKFQLWKKQQHVKTNKRERYTILTTQINFVKGLMVFVRFVLCNNASNVNENWLISYFQN